MLNKSDVGFSRKCPWAVDLENMAMPSARCGSAKTVSGHCPQGDEKAEPEDAKALLDRAQQRLETAGYKAVQTPYGYFNDLTIQAQGHPLARIYKAF
jgi:hypothetical protein